MNIYEWLFCYKDNKFCIRKLNNLRFPFRISQKEIYISKKELYKWATKFVNSLSDIINISELENKIIELSKSKDLDLDSLYPSFWYVTKTLFEKLFGRFPFIDERAEKLMKNIYHNSFFVTLSEKALYSLAYLFAYYRLKRLEEKGYKIIVKE